MDLAQLVPVLLQTLTRQNSQLEAARRERDELDGKLDEILGLLKSMANVVAGQVRRPTSVGAVEQAPVETKSGGGTAADAPGHAEEGNQPVLRRGNVLPADLPPDVSLHYFLSHYQATGADQVGMLQLELEALGLSSWIDNKAEDLTKAGMRAGIEKSGVFLLFLSRGVLSRPFVQVM